MYQSTSSPFRQSTYNNQQSSNNINSPFYQNSQNNQLNSTQQAPPSFSGPQFGGGSNSYSSNSNSNFTSNHPTSSNFNSSHLNNGLNSSIGSSNGGGTQEATKHYLPGYLSSGTLSQSQVITPAGDESRNWDSPNNRNSISGSPVSRFGSHSLFGPREGLNSSTPSRSPKAGLLSRELPRSSRDIEEEELMDQDAPPVESLGEMEGNDSMNSCSSPRRGGDNLLNSNAPSSSLPPPSTTTGTSINVFGFTASALPLILSHFSQFGTILSSTPNTKGGNWLTITYEDSWSAMRAIRRNGEILGGVMMIGVCLANGESGESELNFNNGGVMNSENPTPRESGTSTPSGLGKPISVINNGSAFRPTVSTPTRLSFFSSSATNAQKSSADPHAKLFLEKNLNGGSSSSGQGLMAKASDLIFGW